MSTATATSRPHEEQNQESTSKPSLTIINGQIKTTSLDVAEKFEKLHKDVLRAIKTLECSEDFNRRNFAPVEYKDRKGEKRPMYEITRDGFSILVMGFTGKKAMQWKERYIDAFNMMERRLLAQQRTAIEFNPGIISTEIVAKQKLKLSIGEKIMLVRVLKGMSLITLGHKVYIEQGIKKIIHPNLRIRKIEANEILPEKYLKGELEAIAKALEVSVDFFLKDLKKPSDELIWTKTALMLFPKLPKYLEVLNQSTFDINACGIVSKYFADYLKDSFAENAPCAALTSAPKQISCEKPALPSPDTQQPPKNHKALSKVAKNLMKFLHISSDNKIKRLSILCKKLMQLDPDDKKHKLVQSYLASLLKVHRRTIRDCAKPLIDNDLVVSSRGYLPTAKLFRLVDYLESLPAEHKHKELLSMLF